MLPSHHRHDAVGAEALVIERALEAAGWRVETYARHVEPSLAGRTRTLDALPLTGLEGAVALYHLCLTSPAAELFAGLPCPKVIKYHNITPPEFLSPYNIHFAEMCHMAGRELGALAKVVDVAVADSEFNRLDLLEAGYRVTRTIPILFDPARYEVVPDERMLIRLGERRVVVFVGRIVPNKAPDDFFRVAAACKESGSPPLLFVLVGRMESVPGYGEELRKLIAELGLGVDDLLVTGPISQEELVALYRRASVFLSLSRHEGFMVPLLESMLFGVPIVALSRAAVPETLGDAGILIDSVEPRRVAALLEGLLEDADLMGDLAARGRERLKRYDVDHWSFVFRKVLEGL